MNRRIIFIIASVVVSGIFLVLALQGVPVEDVIDGIRQAEIGWVLLGLFTVFLSAVTRAVRWQGLIGNRAPLVGVYHCYNLTNLINQLPLRAGEVARTVALSSRFGVPLVTAATSVLIERLIDIVMIILLLAVGLNYVDSAPDWVGQAAVLLGTTAVAGFIGLLVLARFPKFAQGILTWLEQKIPLLKRLGLLKRLEEVLVVLEWLSKPSRLLHALIWSVLSWAASLSTFFCLMYALGAHTQHDPILGSMIGVPLVSFSIAIPVSVASIGPFESAVRVAGDLMGMQATLATTLGFLFHGIAALGYVILGITSMIALGVSLGDVMKAPANADNAPPTEA